MSLRKHQKEFGETIDGIIEGSGVKTIVLDVTPGGGKSAIPPIAGKLIKAGLADAIAWIVPRKALQDQGERTFLDPFFRDILGHKLTIRTSTNDVDPCRGLNGLITTYQALGLSNWNLVEDFSRKRYILILDEFHHVAKAGTWHKALAPLVEKAAFKVFMTGTMARGDREDIAFLKYQMGRPVFGPETKYIGYGRTMALQERAIIPLRFRLSDAQAAWRNESNEKVEVESIARVYRPKELSAAIYTAVRTDFAKALLESSLADWRQYRSRTGHMSAFLAVTADVKHAKQVLKYLQARGLHAEIATSHDSPQAHRAIKGYKAGEFDILVSVAMAYEGLDVPRITHIASLTQIRSEPWIIQMLARAVRVDRAIPYEQQEAFIYAPDDHLFRKIVNNIKAEQTAMAGKFGLEIERESKSEGGGGPDVIPIGSTLTGDRSIFLGGGNGNAFTPPPPAPMPKTPTEIEAELRTEIEEHIRKYCYTHHIKIQKINARIKRETGKARPEMTLAELETTLALVRDRYPLDRKGRKPIRPVISKPRTVVCEGPGVHVQGILWETPEWRA